MFEDYQICPYTGLRSFTEDESLYFKGREEDIHAATAQLQRNKFLMLTGASGDGKSSLVYAGIIPNARAGFLKAKYTKWCLADFRPERTPFKNLCRSLANQLEIANEVIVESELRHGFSALVDLYKNSGRYIDQDSREWMESDDKGKAGLKRKAANLIILVDQFEEFFTNPENYNKGVPSEEANLVLNLLLETSRIALEEGLPIYIIFTMRSDYIGQCAAFRGLPEYIGFSQFFVPRLNRAQLQLVIEEPAVLSGNQITRRLTERLIHDLTEGVDQLPILQHALNQIWHAANNGSEEMDLIHYAMVGGMPISEIPEDQISRFGKWFDELPENIKACYHSPSLQNVLDTHTNKLFEQARAYYIENTGREISSGDTKAIIRNAFTCLTKIDQSRAVRNRMNLKEITDILGRPEIGTNEVGAVLNIFREPGNTFIRPFILEDAESQMLRENAVLDITHESLIRNWEYLKTWAEEEYSNYSIYLDYEQQLNRWVESDKSNAFLMSIGPLTYFENWINKLKPNIHWIARYLPEDLDQERKLSKAKVILKDSEEFLSRSVRKHVMTRTVMKYGAKRIGIAVALIAFLVFSSFALRQYLRQQNSFVLNSIQSDARDLVNSKKVGFSEKLYLIVEQLKLELFSIDEVINGIPDPVEKINIANGIATLLVFQGQDEPKKEIFRSFTIADSLMAIYAVPESAHLNYSGILKEIIDLRASLEMAYYYDADLQIDNWRKANAERAGKLVLHILETQPEDFSDIRNLTLALEHAVNYGVYSKDETQKLLAILSPFDGNPVSDWVKNNFDTDKILVRGNGSYGFKHHGLYQQLAYLYASQGNSSKALDCMDILLANAQVNFQGDYASGADNAAHIAFVFYKSGHKKALDEFVKGYIIRVRITENDFYYRLIARMFKSIYTSQSLHLFPYFEEVQNLNLQFSSRADIGYFSEKFRESILSSFFNSDQSNWLLSLSFKMEGILKHIHPEEPKDKESSVFGLFDQAINHYKNVSPAYLDESTTILGISGSGELIVPRKFLFIYPDIRTEFHPNQPRTFFFFYYSDVFLEYLLEKDLLETLYPSKVELDIFPVWLQEYSSKLWAKERALVRPMQFEVLRNLEERLERHQKIDEVDLNRLYLYLGKMAKENGDKEVSYFYYKKVRPEILLNLLQMPLFSNQINYHSFALIASAVSGLAASNDFDTIEKFISPFKSSINRSSIYAFAAKDFLMKEKNLEIADRLLDSAWVKKGRVGNYGGYQGNRVKLAYVHTLRDPKNNLGDAYQLIKNLQSKFFVQTLMLRSIAYHGELYKSRINIPENVSSSDYAKFLAEILYGYSLGLDEGQDSWKSFQEGYPWFVNDWINYTDGSF